MLRKIEKKQLVTKKKFTHLPPPGQQILSSQFLMYLDHHTNLTSLLAITSVKLDNYRHIIMKLDESGLFCQFSLKINVKNCSHLLHFGIAMGVF